MPLVKYGESLLTGHTASRPRATYSGGSSGNSSSGGGGGDGYGRHRGAAGPAGGMDEAFKSSALRGIQLAALDDWRTTL